MFQIISFNSIYTYIKPKQPLNLIWSKFSREQ